MDLNSIDFRDKKVQQITAILLFGIIIAGLIFWFQIKENRVVLEDAISVRDTKQKELNKVRALKPQLDQLRMAVEKLRVELEEYEAIFPSSADTPQLISSITKMARDNQLIVVNFKPLSENVREYYVEHNYQLEIIGAYHKLAEFFEALAEFELLVNVSNLDLKTSSVMNSDIAKYRALELESKYDDRVNSVGAKFKLSTYSSKNSTSAEGQ